MKRPVEKRTTSALTSWRGRVLKAAISGSPGPFINTPLLRLTPDPGTGLDRFWISTWNSNEGSLAALVDESGRHRIYRFGSPRHPGFYSAVQEDDDTLWLCGWLSEVVRFSLRTGYRTDVPAGAPVNDLGWAVDPEGLARLVRRFHARYRKPAWITENGTCDAADAFRGEYLAAHLAVCARLAAEGVPVERYYHWTLLDNFEWAEGESAPFGLVATDFATQRRTVRPSGRLFARIARTLRYDGPSVL